MNTNRELVALGGSNLLAGVSQGFVQLGGSSQTAAAVRAGGKTQLSSLVAAGLVLLTGAFLAPVFQDLPQATLGAIVIVAVAGFFRVGELERFARIRRSALLLALLAVGGVLALGIIPGLIVAAGLSLVLVVQRLSRPSVAVLARDPRTGAWGNADRHPGWDATPGVLIARVEGPLFYANAGATKERLLALVHDVEPSPGMLVLSLADSHELGVEGADMLADLRDQLALHGVELRLAEVRAQALELLRRSGLAARISIEPTVDASLAETAPPERRGPRTWP